MTPAERAIADDVTIAKAVGRLSADTDLRFLIRFLLFELCGVHLNAHGRDARGVDFTLGRQSVGQELISLFEGVDLILFPQLMMEYLNDRHARSLDTD